MSRLREAIGAAIRVHKEPVNSDASVQQQMREIISTFASQFENVEPMPILRSPKGKELPQTVRKLAASLKPIKWSFERRDSNGDVLITAGMTGGKDDYWKGKIKNDRDFEITRYKKGGKKPARIIVYLHNYTGHPKAEGAALVDADYDGGYTAVYCQEGVQFTAQQAQTLIAAAAGR